MKTPQKPAKNILQTGDFKDAKSYHMACSCTSPDHAVDFWVEAEPEFGLVNLNFYTTAKSNYWKQYIRYYNESDDYGKIGYRLQRFANDWINRFVLSAKLIFTGYIQVETTHMMEEQQLANFIGVLQDASKEVSVEYQKKQAKQKQ